MAIWEYKVITSGKGGFATPALLEKFLNDLGKEEWDILSFHTQPDNPLAFHGLARRSTQREWTLEDASAAAKVEADKVRAEFAAKFAGTAPAGGEETAPLSLAIEEEGKKDGLRRLRDTERDHDPEALADEASEDKPGDWDEWPEEDDLPNFFEAIKPHLRRNQRGPGQSVAIDYLAKRWEQRETDIIGALIECGLTVPETDDAPPEFFEFEGDLYWLNRNQRGLLFLNVREKPRPVFRIAQAKKLAADDPVAMELSAESAPPKRPENNPRRAEREAPKAEAKTSRPAAPAPLAPGESLPTGEALLEKLRPMMRRNRRGPGVSGTTSFLAKALKQTEEDLVAALAASGLVASEKPGGKPQLVPLGDFVYWINKDGRGGIWINGRERRDNDVFGGEGAPASETADAPAGEPVTEAVPPSSDGAEVVSPESAPVAEPPVAAAVSSNFLGDLRAVLKSNKRGSGASGELGFLAREREISVETLGSLLEGAGLAIPLDSADKPVFVELGDEILWVNRNAKDGSLWLNAKAKPARKSRPRTTKKKSAE